MNCKSCGKKLEGIYWTCGTCKLNYCGGVGGCSDPCVECGLPANSFVQNRTE